MPRSTTGLPCGSTSFVPSTWSGCTPLLMGSTVATGSALRACCLRLCAVAGAAARAMMSRSVSVFKIFIYAIKIACARIMMSKLLRNRLQSYGKTLDCAYSFLSVSCREGEKVKCSGRKERSNATGKRIDKDGSRTAYPLKPANKSETSAKC